MKGAGTLDLGLPRDRCRRDTEGGGDGFEARLVDLRRHSSPGCVWERPVRAAGTADGCPDATAALP